MTTLLNRRCEKRDQFGRSLCPPKPSYFHKHQPNAHHRREPTRSQPEARSKIPLVRKKIVDKEIDYEHEKDGSAGKLDQDPEVVARERFRARAVKEGHTLERFSQEMMDMKHLIEAADIIQGDGGLIEKTEQERTVLAQQHLNENTKGRLKINPKNTNHDLGILFAVDQNGKNIVAQPGSRLKATKGTAQDWAHNAAAYDLPQHGGAMLKSLLTKSNLHQTDIGKKLLGKVNDGIDKAVAKSSEHYQDRRNAKRDFAVRQGFFDPESPNFVETFTGSSKGANDSVNLAHDGHIATSASRLETKSETPVLSRKAEVKAFNMMTTPDVFNETGTLHTLMHPEKGNVRVHVIRNQGDIATSFFGLRKLKNAHDRIKSRVKAMKTNPRQAVHDVITNPYSILNEAFHESAGDNFKLDTVKTTDKGAIERHLNLLDRFGVRENAKAHFYNGRLLRESEIHDQMIDSIRNGETFTEFMKQHIESTLPVSKKVNPRRRKFDFGEVEARTGRRAGGGRVAPREISQSPIGMVPDKVGYLSQLWEETHVNHEESKSGGAFTRSEMNELRVADPRLVGHSFLQPNVNGELQSFHNLLKNKEHNPTMYGMRSRKQREKFMNMTAEQRRKQIKEYSDMFESSESALAKAKLGEAAPKTASRKVYEHISNAFQPTEILTGAIAGAAGESLTNTVFGEADPGLGQGDFKFRDLGEISGRAAFSGAASVPVGKSIMTGLGAVGLKDAEEVAARGASTAAKAFTAGLGSEMLGTGAGMAIGAAATYGIEKLAEDTFHADKETAMSIGETLGGAIGGGATVGLTEGATAGIPGVIAGTAVGALFGLGGYLMHAGERKAKEKRKRERERVYEKNYHTALAFQNRGGVFGKRYVVDPFGTTSSSVGSDSFRELSRQLHGLETNRDGWRATGYRRVASLGRDAQGNDYFDGETHEITYTSPTGETSVENFGGASDFSTTTGVASPDNSPGLIDAIGDAFTGMAHGVGNVLEMLNPFD